MKQWLKHISSEFAGITSTKKELREFGIVMGIFFLILAGIGLLKHKISIPLLSISGFFFILGFVKPSFLKPLQKLWMGFALIMGFFMTRIILIVLFFLVLTPLSLVSKLVKKRFLDMRFKSRDSSYWIHKPSELPPKEHYERQF